jgi:hypothetical protein
MRDGANTMTALALLLLLVAAAPGLPSLRVVHERGCHGRGSPASRPCFDRPGNNRPATAERLARHLLRLRGGQPAAAAPPPPGSAIQADFDGTDQIWPHPDVVSEAVAQVCQAVEVALEVCAGSGGPARLPAEAVSALRTLEPLLETIRCVRVLQPKCCGDLPRVLIRRRLGGRSERGSPPPGRLIWLERVAGRIIEVMDASLRAPSTDLAAEILLYDSLVSLAYKLPLSWCTVSDSENER